MAFFKRSTAHMSADERGRSVSGGGEDRMGGTVREKDGAQERESGNSGGQDERGGEVEAEHEEEVGTKVENRME